MKKIALISDLHITRGARAEDRLRVLHWIANDLRPRGVALVCIAGDVFQARPDPWEMTAAATLFGELSTDAPIVAIGGNHDVPYAMEMLGKVRGNHAIRTYEQPSLCLLESEGIAVAAFPWPRRAPSLETVRMTAAEAARARHESARAALALLGKQLAHHRARFGSHAHLFLGHLMLHEAMVGIGQPPKQGAEIEFSLDDLALVGADAYLLGHVHDRHAWTIGSAPVLYAGSPDRTEFGEETIKSYAILTVDDAGRVSVEEIPTPAREMVLINARWSAEGGWSVDETKLLENAAGARVRFRYAVPVEHATAARLAATALETRLREAGAVDVRPEAELLVQPRARAPEVAAASTLAEKFDAWIEVSRRTLAPDVHACAHTMLSEFEAALHIRSSAAPSGGTNLRRIRARDVRPFRSLDLDIETLPGPIVVVRGLNGAGKSTLLGCWPGAMYGWLPSRKKIDLKAMALSDDAQIEIDTDAGKIVRAIGDGKAFVYPAGKTTPLDEDGKISGFERWAADHLLASEVFYNALFLAQRSEGLVQMQPGERKAVLLRAIGCGHLERIAKAARDRKTDDEVAMGRAIVDLEHEEQGLPAELDIEAARRAVSAAEAAKTEADRLLDDARAEHDRWSAAGRAWETSAARVAEQEQRISSLLERRATLARLCDRGDAIRRDVADYERLVALRDAAQTAGETTKRDGLKAAEEQRALEQEIDQASARRRSLESDATGLRAKLGDAEGRASCRATAARLDEVTAALGEIDVEIIAAEARLEQARERAGLSERIDYLRGALSSVEEQGTLDEAHDVASTGLREDDEAAQQAEHVPAEEQALRSLRSRRTTLEQDRDTVTGAARLVPLLDTWEARLAEVEQNIAAGEAGLETLRARAREAKERADGLRVTWTLTEEERKRHAAALATLAGAHGQLEQLTRADGALAAIDHELETAAGELARAKESLCPEPPAPATSVGAAIAHVQEAADACSRARVELAHVDGDARRREDTLGRIEKLRTDVARLRTSSAAAAVLALAFGRKGIQAHEIDAAAPKLTTLTNDFLHGCHGPRWTAEIKTTRPPATPKRGKKVEPKTDLEEHEELEDLPLLIHDSIRQRSGDASEFSGGECVIVGHAISIAVLVFVCQRAGAQVPTLVRDESGAALDVENVPAWIAMLRRATDMIGAKHVFIVSHAKAIADLSDVVVEVRDGTLHIGPVEA
jgi:DNA repair exonuclease SbcCD nuclease subunit/energy-coupling factor transporter ATP-binding protein EcfA2